MKKKPKKGGKDAKPQMKTEKVESFFNFFSPPEVRAAVSSIGVLGGAAGGRGVWCLCFDLEGGWRLGGSCQEEKETEACTHSFALSHSLIHSLELAL